MRRLAARHRVSVLLDHGVDGIDCMAAWVKGPVATLVCPDEIQPELRAQLTRGSLGFLMFDDHGSAVALRGAARADAGSPIIEFVVVDGVQLPERRDTNRAPLSIPVRVDVLDGSVAAAIETTSTNLSITGVLLERKPGLGDGPLWRIELVIPGGEEPIRCDAVVARQTPTHVAVAFTEMQPADHVRLTEVLAAHESGS